MVKTMVLTVKHLTVSLSFTRSRMPGKETAAWTKGAGWELNPAVSRQPTLPPEPQQWKSKYEGTNIRVLLDGLLPQNLFWNFHTQHSRLFVVFCLAL